MWWTSIPILSPLTTRNALALKAGSTRPPKTRHVLPAGGRREIMEPKMSAMGYKHLREDLKQAEEKGIQLALRNKNVKLHELVIHIHHANALLDRLEADLLVQLEDHALS